MIDTTHSCPMECSITSSADPWFCTVSLRRVYDDRQGQPLPRPEKVAFGPAITDKADVEIWLRRAQAAIMNPDIPLETFFNKTATECRDMARTDIGFSKNVVCIDIRGPGETDLSFVDLPGEQSILFNHKLSLTSLICPRLDSKQHTERHQPGEGFGSIIHQYTTSSDSLR